MQKIKKLWNIILRLKKSEENLNPDIYADARPPQAEEVAVSKAILMANKYDLNIHICHASTKKSLNLIKRAKI